MSLQESARQITAAWPNALTRRWLPIIVAAGMSIACGGNDAPKIPLSQAGVSDSSRSMEAADAILGAQARAALDSGNALFRKQAYAEALAEYRAASTLAPQHAAPLFGIYMVARATKRPAMADSALAGIRLLNGPTTPTPHTFGDSALRRVHRNLGKKATSG